jgi:hypothetical protein
MQTRRHWGAVRVSANSAVHRFALHRVWDTSGQAADPALFRKSFDACAAWYKLVDHSLFAAGPAAGCALLTLR